MHEAVDKVLGCLVEQVEILTKLCKADEYVAAQAVSVTAEALKIVRDAVTLSPEEIMSNFIVKGDDV